MKMMVFESSRDDESNTNEDVFFFKQVNFILAIIPIFSTCVRLNKYTDPRANSLFWRIEATDLRTPCRKVKVGGGDNNEQCENTVAFSCSSLNFPLHITKTRQSCEAAGGNFTLRSRPTAVEKKS